MMTDVIVFFEIIGKLENEPCEFILPASDVKHVICTRQDQTPPYLVWPTQIGMCIWEDDCLTTDFIAN